MKFPFLGGAYRGRSLNVDAQTCINLMLEGDDKTPGGGALVNTPGYSEDSNNGGAPHTTGIVRGMLWPYPNTNIMVAVVGNRLYTYSGTTWTRVDNLDPGWGMSSTTGPVSMAYMGLGAGPYGSTNFAVAIADGTNFNIYQWVSGQIDAIATPANVGNVVFMDGRFIASDLANTGRFYYSNILSPLTYTAFSFATVEGSPDALTSIFADRRELYLFGEVTTEVWYDTGDATDTFQRYQGGFIQVGCAARYSVARLDNTIIWLATDEKGDVSVALLGPNYTPLTVSTPTMNYLFSQYATVSDAFAQTYRLGGHECYVLTFPTADATWVYDASTKEWHRWSSGSGGRHLMQCMVARGNNQKPLLALSNVNGKVFNVSADTYTDNGVAVYRERTSHHVEADQKRIAIADLQLDMEEGVSTTETRTTVLNSPALVAGDASIVTLGSATVGATDTIAILMDDGRYHLTTVGPASPLNTTTLLLTDAVTGPVAVGNSVVVYLSDTCTLETSKDGGQTFSTARTLHMGVTVTKALRVLLRRMGWARQWTVRFKTQAPVKIVIKGLLARLWGEP